MKIAVCFSGQIRTGNVVAPNILRYIGNMLPYCDFFVHTWDSECIGTGYANRLKVNSLTEDIHTANIIPDKEKVAEFYKFFMPRMMEFEEYNAVPTKNTWGGRRLDPITDRYNISMWESVQKANALKMAYAQQNQLKYDVTIRIRPDIVFHESKSLFEDLKLLVDSNTFLFGDHYGIFPGHGQHRVEDIFWIGPTAIMDKVSSLCEFIASTTTANQIDDPKDPEYKDWQFYGAQWISQGLGIKFRALDNNMMRIYYQIDITKGTDPLNPGFGNAPRYGDVDNV